MKEASRDLLPLTFRGCVGYAPNLKPKTKDSGGTVLQFCPRGCSGSAARFQKTPGPREVELSDLWKDSLFGILDVFLSKTDLLT